MALIFPVIYLFPTHLGPDVLADLKRNIPTLTGDADKAEIFLGKISRKERALLELRCCGIETEDLTSYPPPTTKKRRVQVLKLSWFTDSVEKGVVLPVDNYLIYEGRKITPDQGSPSTKITAESEVDDVMRRAKTDNAGGSQGAQFHKHHRHETQRPHLPKQLTSEEAEAVPAVPAYLHAKYSCERPTPLHPPNEAFIELLEKIRTVRILQGDNISVRAYSTSIATLAAYPFKLSNADEVSRLPGCGPKIAALFQEYKENGSLRETREDETDAKLSVLKLFYNIWGVGDVTALDFYNKGWRDLDDVVEHGWDNLSRVQQIGVKYYEEFLLQMSRSEVEDIAQTILDHANRNHEGFQMVIVGGYRRGKEACGDVDVILSHPEEDATEGVIGSIVDSLEDENFVTRTLSLSTKNSERGQNPRKVKNPASRSGFDGLDKAMVVWQNPRWTTGETCNPNPHRRVDIIISPWKTAGCAVLGWTGATTFERDIRRYCSERKLKFDRYAASGPDPFPVWALSSNDSFRIAPRGSADTDMVLRSGGIFSQTDNSWVDMESGPDGSPAPDMLMAERRIFENLELEWREPWERCTR